jgi:hypothetical protein
VLLRWRKDKCGKDPSFVKPHIEGGSSKYIKTDTREHMSACGLNWLYLEGSVPVVSSRVIARW